MTKYNGLLSSIFLSRYLGRVIHVAFLASSNSLSKLTLFLSIKKQKSLDNLKKSVKTGSLKLTRFGKFKLDGSSMN